MRGTDTGHDSGREQRVGEALGGYLDRLSRGDAEPEAAFLANHPGLADELREHLELIRHLKPDQLTLQTLIAQGLLEPSDDAGYPAKLGPYQVSRFIGRGGMGVVLEAYEESLARPVALKVLRPDLAGDAMAVARFTREAKAAAALRHPNIVTIHAIGQQRQVHYLAMEYIEGPTLAELIRHRGPLPTETIRAVFRQLLEGLAAAHQAGLIHRDIKSSNILIDWGLVIDDWRLAEAASKRESAQSPDDAGTGSARDSARAPGRAGPGCARDSARAPHVAGTSLAQSSARAEARGSESPIPNRQSPIPNRQSPIVKVADFGLARMLSAQTRLTLTGSTPGTPEYMSPEQARGDAELDQRTDLYSAGVVLYEMLTGRTPFRADTPSAVIHGILHEEPAQPRRLNPAADPQLASLALRLMAKRPEDRLPSAMAALGALEAGRPVVCPARRRRVRRHVGLALLLLAAIAAGAAILRTALGPRMIADVWVDETRPTTVLARFGDDPAESIVHVFDPEVVCVRAVAKVDPVGKGKTMIVAGTENPEDGKSIFAFDAQGNALWSIPLIPDKVEWLDCSPATHFRCTHLVAENWDGEPGDELVVVDTHPLEYPTRVLLLDPRTQEIRSTFWHMGRLTGILPIRDFFPEGRPAIIAWGNNNTLDGFKDGPQGDEEQFTHWDIVQALMVLDPLDMDGLGPPPTRRIVGLTSAPIQAYAFLDMPPDVANPQVAHADRREGSAVPQELHPPDAAFIAGLKEEPRGTDQETSPCFRISVVHRDAMGEVVGGVHLTVDRNLSLLSIIPSGGVGDETGHPPEFWRHVWRPIIQNGEYVNGVVAGAE